MCVKVTTENLKAICIDIWLALHQVSVIHTRHPHTHPAISENRENESTQT